MREKHRQIIGDETGRCLESMLRRFGSTPRIYPRLAPGLTHAEVRRTINRLRSGAMRSPEPGMPAHVLADLLEGAIAQDMMIREVVADAHGLTELERRLTRRSR
jgi:hypothetical protein